MRVAFSEAVIRLAAETPELLFLSGDLGFNAFEGLSEKLGHRFINTGVAEQTAVGLAAGLAYRGHKVLWYSIAPFAVYRPLEQIRLDICLHNLPVFVVGNGGGYGYGIMGATHHALEDLACLSCMPNMQCYIPAYDNDVDPALVDILKRARPAYLRLGAGPSRPLPQEPQSVQRLAQGRGLTAVALGPLAHNLLQAADNMDVDVFSVVKLPLDETQSLLWESLRRTGRLLVVEEHTRRGGLAETLALDVLKNGLQLMATRTRSAEGYPDARYGSQSFHRQVCGLDVNSIQRDIVEMLS